MSLREYIRKRRLGETSEPGGERGRAKSARKRDPIFVVQLHHARARHYDFRLEADGVLKSWAVPKGPSLRAGEKRLAVEVEDHPLDYATFEGDIPEGHYGAGHVDIFDHGTWTTDKGDPLEQIATGKLDFELHGERLNGSFALVRTKGGGRQPQWLLLKHRDRFVRDIDADALLEESQAAPEPAKKETRRRSRVDWHKRALTAGGRAQKSLPDSVELELATLRDHPPRGDRWQHEVKWDGYRMLAYIDAGVARLQSRKGLNWTKDFPRLAQALEGLPPSAFIVDGEMVALDGEGRSDFALLQRQLEAGRVAGLRLVLFDLLHLDGVDLRPAPLLERRRLLKQLLQAAPSPVLAFSEGIEGDGDAVFAAAVEAGLEGIISKRSDAPYRGGRGNDWVKVKHVASEEFIVVGYTLPRGSRHGFGSLLLATQRRGALHYAGRVGSGFNDELLRTLGERLESLRTDVATVELPAHVPFSLGTVRWVKPQIVVEVRLRGRGKEGLVRQSSFLRLRDDKPVRQVTAEVPVTKPIASKTPKSRSGAARLTSPERVVFPDAGYTKGDVADYYRAVERWLLPELIERPLSLVRCPDGITSACFFQKHHANTLGANVHSVAIRESEGKDEYLYVRDIEGVLDLVQMNTLELHPWGARIDNVEQPDRLVFDLDPAENVSWAQLKAAARDVRDRLSEVKLDSWVRLSGGKGVHVVVPIRRGPDWSQVKAFCSAFAEAMVEQAPLRYIATASKAARKDRVFIDWLRNTRGATSVASWSLRARPGAPVSMPLTWDELSRVRSANAFDLKKAMRRAATLKNDPWDGFTRVRQSLPTA